MKKLVCAGTLLLLTVGTAVAQKATMATPLGILPTGTEYSKETSLYRAKEFIMTKLLGPTERPVAFEADALSAASSGELTALVYRCTEKQKEGMLLAFWGSKWNPAGVRYQAYGFKDFPKAKANELLEKVQTVLSTSGKVLNGSDDNIYFQYDDLTFLLYSENGVTKMRVFWDDFDSEWNVGSFNRTKKRLEKKL